MRRWRTPFRIAAISVCLGLAGCSLPVPASEPVRPNTIAGPYAALLAASADLGPSGTERAHITAALRSSLRPLRLMQWAHDVGLSVRWRTG